jgi:hypothetical protein
MKTYKAILRNNQLEWTEPAPDRTLREQAVTVYVTIPEETPSPAVLNRQGQNMAAALERIAADEAMTEITDPVAWQREIRQDRVLPDRSE